MSSYTPIITYGPKDALAHGDPNKAIKGAQLDNELSAISTAITGKVDSPLSNIAIGGVANSPATTITANSTASQSQGLKVKAGTNSADYALLVQNVGATSTFLQVKGDGSISGGPGNMDITPSTGTFGVTFAGPAGFPGSGTLGYFRLGPMVWLYSTSIYGGSTGGSGSNLTVTISSLPAAIRPTVTIVNDWNNYIDGSTNIIVGNGSIATINNSGALQLFCTSLGINHTWGIGGNAIIMSYMVF